MWGCCSRAAILISRRNRSGPDRRRQLGAQDLHGDLPSVLDVLCEIHDRHAAAAELALEAVTVA